MLAGCVLFLLSAVPDGHPAEVSTWSAFVERSSTEDDEVIVEVLTTLPLAQAVSVSRALARRAEADIQGVVRGLLASGAAFRSGRAQLLIRVAIEELLALGETARRAAAGANVGTVELLLDRRERSADPMLHAAVWRLAALLPDTARLELLPAARRAAGLLAERFAETAEPPQRPRGSSVGAGGHRSPAPRPPRDPRLVAEARAFVAFAAVVADPTVRNFVDIIREDARHQRLVTEAREVLAAGDS
jgi:hypothetical protein